METKTVTLDDLVDFYIDNRGKTVPTVDKSKEYLPLIATNCITDDHLYPQLLKTRSVDKDTYDTWFRSHLQPGDILFVNKGTPGKVAMVPEPVNFVAAQDMVGLRIKPEYDTKYVFALLKSSKIRKRIDDMQVGTLIPHFKKSDFSNLKIKIIVDKNYQRKIGSLYFDIFNKQYFNQQINKNLLKVETMIFDNWVENTKSETITSLDKIATYQNGIAMQKFPPADDSAVLPVLKIRELNQDCVDSNSDLVTSGVKENVKVYDGDLIFSWSGTLLAKLWTGGDAALNQHLFKVTSTRYPKWFYYLWTLRHLREFQHIAADKKTTMGHIKRKDLTDAKVIIPSHEEFMQLDTILSPIIQQIINNGIESKYLMQLRDLLLPKLLSGDIDLSNIETVMNNA
ncbi:restriction endonuclease subunit S [Lacticaseibacillus suihuaensis]